MGTYDPLVAARTILLADTAVTDLVVDRVYATPILPADHALPCLQLIFITGGNYSAAPFRDAYDATVQVNAWADNQTISRDLGDKALTALTEPLAAGLGVQRVAVVSEAQDVDEQRQPPTFRYRADVLVRVVRQKESV